VGLTSLSLGGNILPDHLAKRHLLGIGQLASGEVQRHGEKPLLVLGETRLDNARAVDAEPDRAGDLVSRFPVSDNCH